MRLAVTMTVWLGVAACGVAPPDAADGDAPRPDGESSVDAGVDAGAVDAAPDAAVTDAEPGPPDADPCETCVAGPECMEAVCDGVCDERPVPDGVTCAGSDRTICVFGACVTRGCGDGYREPGALPAREGCDDGNTTAGDACSPTCGPTALVVSARAGESDVPTGGNTPSVGIDGTGRGLLVWNASDGSSSYSIHARRFSAGGAPLDSTPIVIATDLSGGWAADPTVAGLADGWVVTWASPTIDGELAGVAYRLVAADGTLGPATQANEATFLNQHSPTATRHGDGFAIAWTDQSAIMPGIRWERIQARLFTAGGAPAGSEIEVSMGWDPQQHPSVAGNGDVLLVTWTAVGIEDSPDAAIAARRFDADGAPIDASPFLVSDRDATGAPAHAFGPAAAPLTDGWAVAWTSREEDFVGDVRARTVLLTGASPTGPSVLVAGEVSLSETTPSVAALGDAAYAVLWHRASTSSVVDDILIAPVGATAPPEAVELAALLAAPGNQQTGSLAAAPGRLWIAWSDDGSATGALRTLVMYVLAVE